MPTSITHCFMNAFGNLHTYEEMLQLIDTGDYSHSEFIELSSHEINLALFAAECGADETEIYHELKLRGAAPAFQFECYQCGTPVHWLSLDSRCKHCTRLTPEEITGAAI